MIKFISRVATIFLGGYLLFNFIQFKGGKNIPQLQTFNILNKKDENISPAYPENASYIEKTLTNVFLNILKSKEGANFIQNINLPSNQNDSYLSYMNKEPLSYIKEIKKGIGRGAICNDTVNLTYTIFDQDKNLIQPEQTINVTLDEKIDPNLKMIITKSKLHQELEAQLYETQMNKLKRYNIRINEINPYQKNIENQNLIQKSLQISSGIGKKIFCNDKLKLKFILETNSIERAAVQEIIVTMGSNNLPIELTEIILGQRIGSKISLITNKNMIDQITLHGKNIFNISQIKNDVFLILTIELIEEK